MEISRRHFLAGLATTSLLSANGQCVAKSSALLFAAARVDGLGRFFAVLFDPGKGDLSEVELPARGHDIAVRPGFKECVFFARRPERFAVGISIDGRAEPQWFQSRADRHFFGHGAFSLDGKLLYSTENDYDNGRGVIGVRDASNGYRQIGEFPSYGVGPHDIVALKDQRTLVVANGGLETHPDTGRRPLNLSEMQPSLVYIDRLTGDLLEKHLLERDLHQLSIRHLAAAAEGVVAFGCQYKGSKRDTPPLVGFHKMGETPLVVHAPEVIESSMRQYVGSVSTDRSGAVVAASAPRGNLITYWDVSKRNLIGTSRVEDGCGLAETSQNHSFLITGGQGFLGQTKLGIGLELKTLPHSSSRYYWDNHVAALF